MPEIPTISWSDLPGNKFIKALNPAMFSEQGYMSTQKVRKAYCPSKIFRVVYDQDYLLEWIISKVVKPLSPQGKTKLFQLIDEAWNKFHNIEPVTTLKDSDTEGEFIA